VHYENIVIFYPRFDNRLCKMCTNLDRCCRQGISRSCICSHMLQTPRVDLDPLLSISSMVILKKIDVIVRTEHPKKHDKFKSHDWQTAPRMITLSFLCPSKCPCHVAEHFFQLQCIRSIEQNIPGNPRDLLYSKILAGRFEG
jgi:hypothetical protein